MGKICFCPGKNYEPACNGVKLLAGIWKAVGALIGAL
jgi:hypothetical protein